MSLLSKGTNKSGPLPGEADDTQKTTPSTDIEAQKTSLKDFSEEMSLSGGGVSETHSTGRFDMDTEATGLCDRKQVTTTSVIMRRNNGARPKTPSSGASKDSSGERSSSDLTRPMSKGHVRQGSLPSILPQGHDSVGPESTSAKHVVLRKQRGASVCETASFSTSSSKELSVRPARSRSMCEKSAPPYHHIPISPEAEPDPEKGPRKVRKLQGKTHPLSVLPGSANKDEKAGSGGRSLNPLYNTM